MSKGYRCYDPVTRHFCHSLDVTFLETILYFPGSPSPTGHAPVEPVVVDDFILPHPIPILDSTGDTLPSVITSDPSQVYFRHPQPSDPLSVSSVSSPDSSISHSPLSPIITPKLAPPRYPTRVRHRPARFLLPDSTNHPISQYLSYQDLSPTYQSLLSQVSVPIPRSVH